MGTGFIQNSDMLYVVIKSLLALFYGKFVEVRYYNEYLSAVIL